MSIVFSILAVLLDAAGLAFVIFKRRTIGWALIFGGNAVSASNSMIDGHYAWAAANWFFAAVSLGSLAFALTDEKQT